MRWLLVAVVAVVGAGCSTSEKTRDAQARVEMAKVETTCAPGVNCTADGFRLFRKCTHPSGRFRGCTAFSGRGERSKIEGRRGSRWVVLIGENTAPKRGHGWWRRVIASPDRQTLLGQWSGECEVQSTFLVSVRDGHVRPLFRDHAAFAVGWTRDGVARVRLAEEVWQGTRLLRRTGLYLVDPRTLAVRLERREPRRPGC